MLIDVMRRHAVFIVLAILALLFMGFYLKSNKETVEETDDMFPLLADETIEQSQEVEATPIEDAKLLVDIKGEIKSPGVYQMEPYDRVHDVVEQAGGFTKYADETMINLAQKLSDEMVIYVPMEGEEALAGLPTISSESATDPQATAEGKLHLNSATQADLETLNGIGPKKAEAIFMYREDNGPFQSVEQLTEVSGIGEKTVENIKDQLIVP